MSIRLQLSELQKIKVEVLISALSNDDLWEYAKEKRKRNFILMMHAYKNLNWLYTCTRLQNRTKLGGCVIYTLKNLCKLLTLFHSLLFISRLVVVSGKAKEEEASSGILQEQEL